MPKLPAPLVIPLPTAQHVELPWLAGDRRADADRWRETPDPSSRWDSYETAAQSATSTPRSRLRVSSSDGNSQSDSGSRQPLSKAPMSELQLDHLDTVNCQHMLGFAPDAEVLKVAVGCMAAEARIASRCTRDRTESTELQAGHIKTISLLIVTVLAVGYTVVQLNNVVVPLVLALLLAVLLEPLLSWLMRLKLCLPPKYSRQLRTVFAVVVCVLLMLFCILASGYLVFTSVMDFPVEKYTNSIRLERLVDYLTTISQDLGADGNEQVDESATDTKSKLIDWVVGGPLLSLLGTTLSVISTLFLMSLFLIFLLVDKASHLDDRDEVANAKSFSAKVHRSIKRYVLVKTMASLAICVLTGVVLKVLQVDLAMLFAFLAFLLNFVPHVGYTFSVAGPVVLAYLDPTKSWSDVVLCLIFLSLIHQIIINIVEPRVLARSLDLHPMVVILTLALWTVCWGAVGTLLSTPLTCIFRLVLLEINHPYAVKLANMLEGRPFQQKPSKSSLGPIQPGRYVEAERATVAWVTAMAPPLSLTSVSHKFARQGAKKWMAARLSEEEKQLAELLTEKKIPAKHVTGRCQQPTHQMERRRVRLPGVEQSNLEHVPKVPPEISVG